jgi:hypothetical protein
MYYPSSQIKTGLFTNGNEYFKISDNSIYVGNYWKTSDGKFFTGFSPDSNLYEELFPITQLTEESKLTSILIKTGSVNVDNYLKIKNLNPNNLPIVYSPSYSLTFPIKEDYEAGVFTRYFCKKINELIYLELSKNTYDKLLGNDSSIDYNTYIPFEIPWILKGRNIDQVARENFKNTSAIEKQQNLLGLTQYIKNYSQYYVG